MKLFLDTEFNGFGGELLSMALVPESILHENFYCEIEHDFGTLVPWVKDNVIPHMDSEPVSYKCFQARLENYILQFPSMTIIVDWPDDVKYFCEALITAPGERIMIPSNFLQFKVDCNLEGYSNVPHHALHDAIGLRDEYFHKSFLRN